MGYGQLFARSAMLLGLRAASFALLLMPAGAIANADEPKVATDVFSLARGGQLYDKWWAVVGADKPKGTHSAYTAKGKKKGASTWRCKECHGWDYKGRDGAYGKGSHFSGIKGITGLFKADPKAIAKAIRGKPHNFTRKMLPDKAVERLARFVSAGQLDMDKYINRASKKAKGDAARGAGFYQTVCANCHGFDGKLINFKTRKKPEFIGTVANANPWETLHKIRNGQPGQAMPALIALDVQDLVDIVAYTQTLPAK